MSEYELHSYKDGYKKAQETFFGKPGKKAGYPSSKFVLRTVKQDDEKLCNDNTTQTNLIEFASNSGVKFMSKYFDLNPAKITVEKTRLKEQLQTLKNELFVYKKQCKVSEQII